MSQLNLETLSDDERLASNRMKAWLEELLRCQSKGIVGLGQFVKVVSWETADFDAQ